jgi:hypothetical protein
LSVRGPRATGRIIAVKGAVSYRVVVKVKHRQGHDRSFEIPARSPSHAREIQNRLIDNPTSHPVLAQELERRAVGIFTDAQSVLDNDVQVARYGDTGQTQRVHDHAEDAAFAVYHVHASDASGRAVADKSFGAFGSALGYLRNTKWETGVYVTLTTSAIDVHAHKVLPMAQARRIHARLAAQGPGLG